MRVEYINLTQKFTPAPARYTPIQLSWCTISLN
jgi:hypothetical protein